MPIPDFNAKTLISSLKNWLIGIDTYSFWNKELVYNEV